MNSDFAILAQFLDNLGPEVSGHSSSPLTADQLKQIERFAAGQLDNEERRAFLPEILGNEQALHELVKRLRPVAQ